MKKQINPHPKLNKQVVRLHSRFASDATIGIHQRPRNTLSFREIFEAMFAHKILPLNGFTYQDVKRAFKQHDFRPPTKSTLDVMMNNGNLSLMGHRCIAGKYYAKGTKECVIAKLTQAVMAMNPRKLTWTNLALCETNEALPRGVNHHIGEMKTLCNVSI